RIRLWSHGTNLHNLPSACSLPPCSSVWLLECAMIRSGRVLIVTDAWHPQVNGVVRTLSKLAEELSVLGVETCFLTPERFRSFPMPFYPDIRLALATPGRIAREIAETAPDFIHIATEGPLGQFARRACRKQGRV